MKNSHFGRCLLLVAGALGSCCDDPYPGTATLIIPVETSTQADTLQAGEAYTVSINLPKEVSIRETDQEVRLDQFDFMMDYVISEISTPEERFDFEVTVDALIGEIQSLSLSGAGVKLYPLRLLELEDHYELSLAITVADPGTYLTTFSYNSDWLQSSGHEFTNYCDDAEGRGILYAYENNATSEQRFNELVVASPVEYLGEVYDFARYRDLGAYSFVVVE